MRHASHEHGWLTDAGRAQVAEVARTLAERAAITCQPIADVVFIEQTVECSDGAVKLTNECEATARCLVEELRSSLARLDATQLLRCASARRLDVTPPATYSTSDRTRQLREVATAVRHIARAESITVTVTNEPQVGWLLDELTGAPTAFSSGEVIAVGGRRVRRPRLTAGRWFVRLPSHRVRWALTPGSDDDEAVGSALLAKVESKMRTAGVFGGLISALLTFVLTSIARGHLPTNDATLVSLAGFAASAWWFFATLFFYDRLTMPVRFWAHGRAGLRAAWRRPRWLLERPPSSSRRVLHQNMVRIWTYVFLPATLALGVGVVSLLWALDGTQVGEPETVVDITTSQVVGLASASIAVVAWTWWFRPRVGSDD